MEEDIYEFKSWLNHLLATLPAGNVLNSPVPQSLYI